MGVMKLAVKSAMLDFISIIIASFLGAVLVLVSFKDEFFIGFFAYVAAIVVVVLGVCASKRYSSSSLAYVINVVVTSLVCISFTFTVTLVLAGFMVRYMGGLENPIVEAFKNKYSALEVDVELLFRSAGGCFGLVLANRLANEMFKGGSSQSKKTSALHKLCASILYLASFPVNIFLAVVLLVASLYFAVLYKDVYIFAAAGGPITMIGLFSTIQFTKIEKYIKREALATKSTEVTALPLVKDDHDRTVTQRKEAASKRLGLELKSELSGIALTIFGTLIWAYGKYIPISCLIE